VRSYWLGLTTSDGSKWLWSDGRSASELPAPWSDKQPAESGASGVKGAAFLQIAAEKYDTGLASVETNPAVMRPYVCERSP
jgi:hypothetical protein